VPLALLALIGSEGRYRPVFVSGTRQRRSDTRLACIEVPYISFLVHVRRQPCRSMSDDGTVVRTSDRPPGRIPSRRFHQKSRSGCARCKARRVKASLTCPIPSQKRAASPATAPTSPLAGRPPLLLKTSMSRDITRSPCSLWDTFGSH